MDQIVNIEREIQLKIESNKLELLDLNENNFSKNYPLWLNNTDVNCFLESKYFVHTSESCKKYITESNNNSNVILKGIFFKSNSLHIGNIRLEIDNNHSRATVGFLLGDINYWSKGYMSIALKLALDYTFNTMNIDKIEAGCYESNTASLKTMLKTGFVVEGFRRESVFINGKREGLFQLGITRNDFNIKFKFLKNENYDK